MKNISFEDIADVFGDNKSLDTIVNQGMVINQLFMWMPRFLGLPTGILNLLVLLVLLTVLSRAPQTEKPAFIFLGNLALSDMVLSLVEFAQVQLRQYGHHSLTPLDSRPAVCQAQIGLWTFTIFNSILSSVVITIDRYVYISYSVRYPGIVTNTKIIIALILAWVVPAIYAVTSAMTYRNVGDLECIVGHHVPATFIVFILTFIMTIWIIFYLLYGLILIKFYRQKEKLESAQARWGGSGRCIQLEYVVQRNKKVKGQATQVPGAEMRPGIEFHQIRFGCLKSKVVSRKDEVEMVEIIACKATDKSAEEAEVQEDSHSHSQVMERQLSQESRTGGRSSGSMLRGMVNIAKFIKAAKYVLILLFVFTVCWLPWTVILYYDFLSHATEDFYSRCLDTSSTRPSLSDVWKTQDCVLDLLRQEVSSCLIPPPHQCQLITEAVHTFKQDNLQLLALMIGATNSLINPVIYGFWYPDFRRTAIKTMYHCTKKFKI